MNIKTKTVFDRSRDLSQDFDGLGKYAYGYIKGRTFGGWIDDNSRSNGYNAGDLIENPAYIIESILRDEIFVERNLRVTTNVNTTSFIATGLLSTEDDYYNGAYVYDIEASEYVKITDYDGSTKTITVASSFAHSLNDNIIVTNIKGDSKIDYASFDAVGNTTNGTRDDWKLTFSLTDETGVKDLIQEICESSFLMLIKSYDKYKLVTIDETASTPDVWTNPLKTNGRELVSVAPLSLDFVYNDFKFNFRYHYGRDKSISRYYVNRNGYTSGLTNGSTLQGLCEDVYTNYKIDRLLETEYKYIRFSATAEMLFEKLVEWRTKQRLLVQWSGTFKEYCTYEVGDIVKINHWLIPDALRNVSQFMITNKEIVIQEGNPYISFSLIQLG